MPPLKNNWDEDDWPTLLKPKNDRVIDLLIIMLLVISLTYFVTHLVMALFF